MECEQIENWRSRPDREREIAGPSSTVGSHRGFMTNNIRVWGNLGTRVAWDHEIVGSNPITRTFKTEKHTARSFNGRGCRPDKAETKVRLLLGLFERNTKRRCTMDTLQRWIHIHQTTHGVVV